MESVVAGTTPVRGYRAADAAHMFEEFLERRLSLDEFWQWLQGYRGIPRDVAVEDEINRAVLIVRALQEGTRTWEEAHRELLSARGRLSGLARLTDDPNVPKPTF